MSKEKDYTAQNTAAVRKKERELARAEAKAEAAEESMSKALAGALKNRQTKQNISKQFLDGYEGKYNNKLEVPQWGGEGTDITGWEEKPWEEDD
jgi:hypothetical protein